MLGKHFHEKILQLHKKIAALASTHPTAKHPNSLVQKAAHLDTLHPVMVDEVATLITKMTPKTSSVDFLATSVLKQLTVIMSPLIANLSNLSFTPGVSQ